MQKITKKEGEDRKTYLARVAVALLEANDGTMTEETIIYDDAECDASCLAEDMKNEFDIEEE